MLEMRDIRGNKTIANAGHLSFIFVDVVVELQESTMIYSGILSDNELGNDGGLKCIYLKETRRKHLNTRFREAGEEGGPGPEDNSYYKIQGDLLVIPYGQMLNLNFTCYIDQEDATEEGDSPDLGTTEVRAEE
jgi:hypothetical protein